MYFVRLTYNQVESITVIPCFGLVSYTRYGRN